MENKVLTKVTSIFLIVVMAASVFSVISFFDQNKVAASTDADLSVKAIASTEAEDFSGNIDIKSITPFTVAYPKYNKNTFPTTVKAGKKANVWADGHRYSEVYKKLVAFSNNGNIDVFTQGETYYEPASMTLKHKKLGTKTINFYHLTTKMYERQGVYMQLDAGKYTITTKFRKCYVDVYKGYSYNSVSFIEDTSAALDTKTNTFYVKAKVKFAYDKKKGKLAKKKRIKYLAPTKKYGKLPKPKAKSGKKFIGWYTKKSGGKKVTKNTKVPTKNSITLYARYK